MTAAKPDKLSLIPRTHKLLGRKEPVLASCPLASVASPLTSPSQAHMHKISKCVFFLMGGGRKMVELDNMEGQRLGSSKRRCKKGTNKERREEGVRKQET